MNDNSQILYSSGVKNAYLRCLLISLITGTLSFSYFLIKSKGFLTIADDFNNQQLAFAAAVWTALRNGDIGEWVWNLDLGSSLITGFSFYNLGSPFFWISLLFPKEAFPYLAGPLFVMKYTVASMTAYLYLRLFNSKNKDKVAYDYSLIGALLYAFSGFQTTNLMFFHFHDVVAFFPLLLWGVERSDDRKYRFLFSAAVFVNCLVNYFFFVQEVIFLGIYFLFRFWGHSAKAVFQRLRQCFLYGLLGIGMASILFIPNVLYILDGPRGDSGLLINRLTYDSRGMLFVLKGILLPGDVMRDHSVLFKGNWNSTSCYLPLFGLAFVILYLIYRNDWLKKLLLFLLVISFSPTANSGFLLFTEVYQRWWYMLVLLLTLATVKVLEELPCYNLYRGIWVYVLIESLFYLYIRFVKYDASTLSIVNYEDRFTLYYAIAVSGPVLIAFAYRFSNFFYSLVLGLTICSCIITTGLTLHYYRTDVKPSAFRENYYLSTQLEPLNDSFRYTLPSFESSTLWSADSIWNLITLVSRSAGGYASFSSTIENSSRRFDEMFGIVTSNKTIKRDDIPGLGVLLGGKYRIIDKPDDKDVVKQVSYRNKSWFIKEEEALPIGFSLDKYILASEVYALPKNQRAIALMHAGVVFPQDVIIVQQYADHINVENTDFEKPYDELVKMGNNNAVDDFKRDSHGFSCTTNYDSDRLIYFSVPYSSGWTAIVNGEKAEIVNSCGMMLLPVHKGPTEIKFIYHTPGFREGAIITLISFMVWVIGLYMSHKRCLRLQSRI